MPLRSIREPRIRSLRGSESGSFLFMRGGLLRSMGNFPEKNSRRFLVCGFSIRGLAVSVRPRTRVDATNLAFEIDRAEGNVKSCDVQTLLLCGNVPVPH